MLHAGINIGSKKGDFLFKTQKRETSLPLFPFFKPKSNTLKKLP